MSGIINPPSGTLPHNHDASNIVSGQFAANRLPAIQNPTAFAKDNVVVTNWLFQDGQIQCYANNGGIPAFGLHSGNKEAVAFYYLNGQIRTKRNTDEDFLIAEEESGAWTPIFSPGNHTYAPATAGIFRRVGSLVFVQFTCSVLAKDSSVNSLGIFVAGLPIPHANSGTSTIISVGTGGVSASGGMVGLLGPEDSAFSLTLQQGANPILFSACSSTFFVRGTFVYPI